jgi:ATP-dependent RNA helicase DeaD
MLNVSLKTEGVMLGNADSPVTGPVAAALSRLELPENDPNLLEIVPAAARGHNVVVVTPPAALHAAPGLAGAIGALPGQDGGLLLVLVAEAAMGEWETVISAIARDTGHTVHAVRTLSRASRLLQAGTVDILIASPEAALALAQRSALKADRVSSVFMAWPEFWDSDEPLTPLMQDIGRDVQRIIYTTEQTRVATLVERHARRAHTVGPIPGEMPVPDGESPRTTPSGGVIRLVSCPWSHREQALKETIELLDPSSSAAWTLTSDPAFIPALPPGTALAPRRVPRESVIVAYDLPTAAQLVQLAAAGEVVVLVPPTAQSWIKRVVPQAKPLRLPGASDAAGKAAQARRQQIVAALETRSVEGGLLALAPLFERYDPATLAAILYQLWLDRPDLPPPTLAPSLPADVMSNATARVWVGVGKKDGATPNDFVGVLTKELRYERSRIGKIEVRELYSLVEVPAGEAESLANRLTGVTIRRRRVTARIDKGGKVRTER